MSATSIISSKENFELAVKRRCAVQNYSLVWLDSYIDGKYQNSIDDLRKSIQKIDYFIDIDQCIDFITDMNDEKIFLIISHSSVTQILSILHEISQLKSIYIFGDNPSQMVDLTKGWLKIKGIFTEINSLHESLKQETYLHDQNSIAMSFVTKSANPVENLNELDQTFMYTQILKEILLELEYDEQSIKNYASYCRVYFAGNRAELEIVNMLEKDYRLHPPIWWYSAPYFIYSMLNRALRIQDVETIIQMGFFIRDLHENIKKLHQIQAEIQPFIVYRGQGLSKENFEKLLQSKGGLMSFNSFLSTSKDHQISLAFAKSNRDDPGLIGVLFKINVIPSIPSAPFALLNNISQFDYEEEILFSMHTIFRIGEMKQMNDTGRLWEVELKLTSDHDEQLSALTEKFRDELTGYGTGWLRLGELLMKLDEFNKAQQLFETLLLQTHNDIQKSNIYGQIGLIHHYNGNYELAMFFSQKKLEILNKTFPNNHEVLAICYGQIGMIYRSMGKYSESLLFQKKAVEILQKILPEIHPGLAMPYHNVSKIYQIMGNYSEALFYAKKAILTCEQNSPSNHPDLALAYNTFAVILCAINKYSEARTFCDKALTIWQKVLPSNHSLLALGYNNIGLIYQEMGSYFDALQAFEKALDVWKRTIPVNEIELALNYNNIGLTYSKMKEYSKALSFHQKAREIYSNLLPSHHPDLAVSYNNTGAVYSKMKDYKNALLYHEKALEIREKSLPSNHPLLITTYEHMYANCLKIDDQIRAIFFIEKILEVDGENLSSDHSELFQLYLTLVTSYHDAKNSRTHLKVMTKH